MAKLQKHNGSTSVVLRAKIYDSAATTGAGKAGLTNASAGLVISTIADVEATATAYTAAGSTIDTIATLGTFAAPTAGHCRFKEVDATNHPGVYEIQILDARFAVAGAKSLLVTISGASGAAQCDLEVQLTAADPDTAIVPANVTQWLGGTPNALSSGRVDASAGAVADKAGYSLATTPPTASAISTVVTPAVVAAMATNPVGSVVGITGLVLDAGTVSVSPTPSTTVFAATGLPSGLASGDLAGMSLIFQTGNRAGARRTILSHAVSGSTHTFTLTTALGAVPAATDTFLVG